MTFFAPTAATYRALIDEVQAAGLNVVSTSDNRATLSIAGSSALIDRIFQTDIHAVYQTGAGYRYANSRPATMPQRWVGLVNNIAGFDNLESSSVGRVDAPHRPFPRPIQPLLLHTTTYAYDGHFLNGNENGATVRRWLNYAEGAGQKTPDKAVDDGDHCTNTCSVFYVDFARLDSSQDPALDFLADPQFTECNPSGYATGDWVLHQPATGCGPTTRTSPSPNQFNGNYGNLNGIGAKFLSYIQGTYAGKTQGCCQDPRWNNHDYIFQDTTSTDLLHDTKCCATTLEFQSDPPFLTDFTAFQTSLVHVNGVHFHNGDPYLSFPNGFADGQTADETGDATCEFCLQDFGSANVAGGVCEFCLQNGTEIDGDRYMYPLFVPYAVNVATDVIGDGHQFINLNEYNRGFSPPNVGASNDDRYLLYATYMLYYQPNDTHKAILWEDFDPHGNSSPYNGVFPEQALVGYNAPAIPLSSYLPAANGIGLAGCTPSEGDSGGIIPYLIPNTCRHGNYNGTMHWLGMYGQIYSSGTYPSGDIKTGSPALIGPIAFVINLTTTAQTVPCTWLEKYGYTATTFHHEIVIATPGDVLNGGSLDFMSTPFACDTQPSPTTIPAQSARFLGV
jgi:hypothetical protein